MVISKWEDSLLRWIIPLSCMLVVEIHKLLVIIKASIGYLVRLSILLLVIVWIGLQGFLIFPMIHLPAIISKCWHLMLTNLSIFLYHIQSKAWTWALVEFSIIVKIWYSRTNINSMKIIIIMMTIIIILTGRENLSGSV